MRELVARGRKVNLLLVRERSRGILVHEGFRAATIQARDKSGLSVRLGRWCATIASNPDISRGIAPRDRDPRVLGQRSPNQRWDRSGYNISLHSPEEPVSVSKSYTGTSRYTGRPERPDYGLRQRTRPTSRGVRGSGACLRHHTTG